MKQALILLISIVVVFVAPGAQGTAHLSFSNVTANVTRTGCGTDLLCVETPDDCDPAGNDSCLFASINGTAGVAPNGTTLNVQLRVTIDGDGYVALGLTANASEGTSMVFICARNNTSTNAEFFFRTMLRNNTNGMLSSTERNVTEIQNSITNTTIQCEFNVPGVNASMSRTGDTTFVVLLGTGIVNGSTIGNLNVSVSTDPLNLLDSTSNLNNNNNNNTNNNTNNNNNTTSAALVTRMGCGSTKLCVETPEDCDPATNNTCLFTSINGTAGMAPNGTTLHFELSGTTSGDSYVGVALTANASEGTAMLYVCGRNGTTNGTDGTFFFLTVQRNNTNGELTVMNGMATGIQNLTTDARIQCVFYVPGVNASRSRTGDTNFVVLLGTGSVNGNVLGSFTPNVTTPPLNVINPTSNLNNNNNNTNNNNNNNNNTSSALVTRMGCGSTKLCVETPEDCDPATNNTCLFTSINGTAGMAPNGTTLHFELSGTTSGDSYVGVALTANASEGTAMLYVCGRNGTTNGTDGTFFFLTVQRNNTNGELTVMNGMATGIQNLTTDTRIQCVFYVPGVNASRSRTMDTTFVILLGTGSVNGSTIGNLNVSVTTNALNVVDPTSNLNNNNNNNTNNNTTTTSSLNITRMGCGSTKLCVETPEDCDPATNDTCLFTSVSASTPVASNGTTLLSFELSGTSSGDSYVGVALTANASEGTATLYVCGRNGTTNGVNGTFFFLTVQRNNTNGELTVMNGMATGIQNLTTDTRIQCVFDIPVGAPPRSRNAATTFVLQLGSGMVNGSDLGSFTANVTTPPLNLADPASNVNTTTTSSALVTRMGCGSTKLCVETPEDCDPATNNTCLFTSINGTAGMAPNGTTLHFELSGTTSGDSYVGVALTANASEGTAMLYVCGRNGTTNGTDGTFFFLTVQRNNTNGELTVMNGMARGIQNLTTDARIQCVFYVPGVNASRSRTMDTTFVVQLGSGRVNGSTLGSFTPNVTTPPLNVIDPTSNLNNNATTASPPTTMSGANRALFPQALPLLLSIFILSILKTA